MGGIYANNPTLLAIKKVQALYPKAKEILVYSLGTGRATPKDLSDLGNGSIFNWAPTLPFLFMKKNAANYTETLIHKEMAQDSRIRYVRLQPPIEGSEEAMDNVNADNIENLKKAALATILKERKPIEEIIEDFLKDYGTRKEGL